MSNWRKDAQTDQQYYCDMLGDKDYVSYVHYDPDERLRKKIAYALFRGPSNMKDYQEEVTLSDYSAEQIKAVTAIYNKLNAKSGNHIKASFIFLIINEGGKGDQQPVIRFVQVNGYEVFMDIQTRIYSSWRDFLDSNELPECSYCYPEDGWYKKNRDGQVSVKYTNSPQCETRKKMMNAADKASTVANIGSTMLLVGGVGLSALCPPAAAAFCGVATLLGGSSGAYLVVRNTGKLIDRATHAQSIDPISDAQARSCWLGVVGGALGTGTMAATKHITNLAKQGSVVSKAMAATLNTLNISSLGVNGIGIFANVYDLSQKDKITTLDVANLSLSILFFTNSAVNLKTARMLIRDVQKNVIDSNRSQLSNDPRAKRGFEIYRMQNRKKMGTNISGDALTIRRLQKIDDPKAFFANISLSCQEAENRAVEQKDGRPEPDQNPGYVFDYDFTTINAGTFNNIMM